LEDADNLPRKCGLLCGAGLGGEASDSRNRD
jgi:hypothetical protein